MTEGFKEIKEVYEWLGGCMAYRHQMTQIDTK